jgi:outer membrane protein OmpA-like peptidoglycan-associated protein
LTNSTSSLSGGWPTIAERQNPQKNTRELVTLENISWENFMPFLGDNMIRTLLAGSLTWIFFGSPTFAGDLSRQQILDALTPPKVMRGLTAAESPAADHRALIDNLRHRGNRSLTLTERDEIASMAGKRPSVDLQIYFDFDSAAVTPEAVPQLNNLGNALADPELKDSLVTINGHTDAKGTDSYNQKLSERRAETIKRYLVDQFHLSSENLVTIGYGKQKPKNAVDPFASENRRVQIVNLDSQTRGQR